MCRILFSIMKGPEPSLSRSVDRTVRIVEALSRLTDGAGATELQRLLGYPASTVYGVVMTLTRWGWLRKDPHSNKYYLTPQLFALGSSSIMRTRPLEIFYDIARGIVRECGDSVYLGVLAECNLVLVAAEYGTHPIQTIRKLGEQLPAHATAMGKVLLAAREWSEVVALYRDRPLTRLTGSTISSLSHLKRELSAVRQQGYALNVQESVKGEFGVAAPVKDEWGRVWASLDISAILDRTPVARQTRLIRLVREHATKMSGFGGTRPVDYSERGTHDKRRTEYVTGATNAFSVPSL